MLDHTEILKCAVIVVKTLEHNDVCKLMFGGRINGNTVILSESGFARLFNLTKKIFARYSF